MEPSTDNKDPIAIDADETGSLSEFDDVKVEVCEEDRICSKTMERSSCRMSLFVLTSASHNPPL